MFDEIIGVKWSVVYSQMMLVKSFPQECGTEKHYKW